MSTIPFLLGRIVFGGFFLYNGVNHIRQRRMLAQYAASKNVPMAEVGVDLSTILLLAGGASIATGVKPQYGALAIITFLAGVSPTIHDFWRIEDPGQRANDMVNFGKNVALAGAALALAAVPEPWPASLPVAQPEISRRALAKVAGRIAA